MLNLSFLSLNDHHNFLELNNLRDAYRVPVDAIGSWPPEVMITTTTTLRRSSRSSTSTAATTSDAAVAPPNSAVALEAPAESDLPHSIPLPHPPLLLYIAQLAPK